MTNPFIILAFPRSGTTMLTSALNSHPLLTVLGEGRGDMPLNWLRFLSGLPANVGFNLKYQQTDGMFIPHDDEWTIPFSILTRFRVIHVVREDLLRHALSRIIAYRALRPGHTGVPPQAMDSKWPGKRSMYIEPEDVSRWMIFINRRVRHWQAGLDKGKIPHICVSYEQLTGGGGETQRIPDPIAKKILGFLGVPKKPLPVPMRKVNPRSEKDIENWDDLFELLMGVREEYGDFVTALLKR